jgi:Flp pilus assembly protein TadG
MVETAIVVLLALTVLFAIMEFGRALFTYHAISNAARLGTRYAIVHGANCIPNGCTASLGTIQQYLRDSTPGIKPSQLRVTTATWTGTALDPSKSCGSGANENQGCTVTITVQYQFSYILPYFGNGFNISSTSQMVVAN